MAVTLKPKNPSWWTKNHDTAWAKIKHALKAGWRGDPGTTGAGGDFHAAESALRYGHGARTQHGHPSDDLWEKAEPKLAAEWSTLGTGREWSEARAHVMQGWNSHTRHATSEAIGTASASSGASGFGAGPAGDSGSGAGP